MQARAYAHRAVALDPGKVDPHLLLLNIECLAENAAAALPLLERIQHVFLPAVASA